MWERYGRISSDKKIFVAKKELSFFILQKSFSVFGRSQNHSLGRFLPEEEIIFLKHSWHYQYRKTIIAKEKSVAHWFKTLFNTGPEKGIKIFIKCSCHQGFKKVVLALLDGDLQTRPFLYQSLFFGLAATAFFWRGGPAIAWPALKFFPISKGVTLRHKSQVWKPKPLHFIIENFCFDF